MKKNKKQNIFGNFKKKKQKALNSWWGPIMVAVLSFSLLILHCHYSYWLFKVFGIFLIVVFGMIWEFYQDSYDLKMFKKDQWRENRRFRSLRNQAALFVRVSFMIGVIALVASLMTPDTENSPEFTVYYLTIQSPYQFK